MLAEVVLSTLKQAKPTMSVSSLVLQGEAGQGDHEPDVHRGALRVLAEDLRRQRHRLQATHEAALREPRELVGRRHARRAPMTLGRNVSSSVDTHRVTLVSVNKHSFYTSLCHAIKCQQLLSSPWFGALRACLPKELILLRSVCSQTPVITM